VIVTFEPAALQVTALAGDMNALGNIEVSKTKKKMKTLKGLNFEDLKGLTAN
jgi:hypothetical protein